jgi:hypothetical protein
MGGWAIAVHGGAGVDPNLPRERQEEAKKLLTRCLQIGISALRSNLPAIDVVELVVCDSSLSVLISYKEFLCSQLFDHLLWIENNCTIIGLRFLFHIFVVNKEIVMSIDVKSPPLYITLPGTMFSFWPSRVENEVVSVVIFGFWTCK